ncbi:MAG: Ig-like domain-containing protein [Acidobacteriota bacterium]|nr:Ig-like domain-containing protein [Acidobacteriota bacterium]
MREIRHLRFLGVLAASAVLFAFGVQALRADVVLTDKQQVKHQQDKLEKKAGHRNRGRRPVGLGMVVPMATGSIHLFDGDGLEWFVNTDITFVTSSSASGAMSEASYSTGVTATTLGGGTTNSSLSDAFDGYNSIALTLNGDNGPVNTSDADYRIFNQNGPAALDPDSSGREYVFPIQHVAVDDLEPESAGPAAGEAGLDFWRKVYVPSDDSFARWLNFVENRTAEPVTVTLVTSNNLGSDSNTRIFATSDGDTAAELTDTWVGTFQNYSGTTSPDVRLAHVLQGPGDVAVPLSKIVFADGDDNPYWAYTMTIPAGETYCIMNFAIGQPSKAQASAKAAELAGLPAGALKYMSDDEKAQVMNFNPSGQYWVSVKSTAGGSTDPRDAFQVAAGSNQTVTAYPDAGYKFLNWTGEATGTANPITFAVDHDCEITAHFLNLPPTVQITSPAADAAVLGTITVTATASDDSGVAKVEFYVDGTLKATDAAVPYAFEWNTLNETPGVHALKAVAYDVPGLTGSHQISVNAANVTLTMVGSRMTDRAWIISREYAKLQIQVGGAGVGSVQKYILYRKKAAGAYAAIKELTTAEVGSSLAYDDKYLDKGVSYTYKLVAVIGGAEVVASNEVTI